MRRVQDFTRYEGVLPYASEIFGVFQPLLGWRSERSRVRTAKGFARERDRALRTLIGQMRSEVDWGWDTRKHALTVRSISPGELPSSERHMTGTFVGRAVARSIKDGGSGKVDWVSVLSDERIDRYLTHDAVRGVAEAAKGASGDSGPDVAGLTRIGADLAAEASTAGVLKLLRDRKAYTTLNELFLRASSDRIALERLLIADDPLEVLDPAADIDRASLAPIGMIHLFRQYFFELDSFLGSPVSHVWLGPGSTVELLEVTTRKRIEEQTLETFVESIVKTDKSVTNEDEISEAVKTDNKSDTRFAMNATVEQGWIGGSASASASLNLDSSQQTAREQTHRHMRQQTERLATELRRNFKSTFRVATETTDVSSKRHVLTNPTDDLLNYELRTKMRQVGVQVQDIGTYLCWQTYVDDPGRQLGIAELVHIAQLPDAQTIPPPEAVPMPPAITTSHPIDIPFIPMTEDTTTSDMDEAYEDGYEIDTDTLEGDPEQIQWKFDGIELRADQAGYEYGGLEVDYGGADAQIEIYALDITTPQVARVDLRLHHVNFRSQSPIRITLKVTWNPSQAVRDEVEAQNQQRIAQFSEATKRQFEEAMVTAAQERVTISSKIEARSHTDLREEERIVVYRALIGDLLTAGIPMTDDRTRHVVAELLNTIFDVDKMLYFVAPEWWRPRLHRSRQRLQGSSDEPKTLRDIMAAKARGTSSDTLPLVDTADGGGGGDGARDSYFITEDSDPAALGSSLGWLLQLDGDNMRNAFLNAPWVKAVIPIRPGRERAALNWLSQVHVEGTDGLDDTYLASADELGDIPHSGPQVTVRDALDHLCDVVSAKHQEESKVSRYPTEEADDSNRVSATPLDRVYEHGFYPLAGGFRLRPDAQFEVFDQWIEIVPTDQTVPVPVAYDPLTGRQI